MSGVAGSRAGEVTRLLSSVSEAGGYVVVYEAG